jgi:hypothetical protein
MSIEYSLIDFDIWLPTLFVYPSSEDTMTGQAEAQEA